MSFIVIGHDSSGLVIKTFDTKGSANFFASMLLNTHDRMIVQGDIITNVEAGANFKIV